LSPTPARRAVESSGCRPSGSPAICCASNGRAPSASSRSASISASRRLRDPALDGGRTGNGSASCRRTLAQAGLDRQRRAGRCPWRRPPPCDVPCPARHPRHRRSRFAALRAHQIVAINRCPVLAPSYDGAVAAARAAPSAQAGRARLDIQVTATEAGIDMDVRGLGPAQHRADDPLAQLADKHRLARLTRHGELDAQRAAPTVIMGRAARHVAARRVSAGDRRRREHPRSARRHPIIGRARAVADLFCGLGHLRCRLAERVRVAAFAPTKPRPKR